MRLTRSAFAGLLLLAATPVLAQSPNAGGNEFSTATPGKTAVGVVQMCLDTNSVAVPCSGSGSSATNVTIVGPDGPEGGVSVSINPYRMDATNNSGSVTVGGAWQQVFAADALRIRLAIQNYCSATTQAIAASESLFVAVSPTMPAGSPLVVPGPLELVTCGSYDSSSAVVGTSPVWVWAASTGHHFSALQW